jgi:hypothetical protein
MGHDGTRSFPTAFSSSRRAGAGPGSLCSTVAGAKLRVGCSHVHVRAFLSETAPGTAINRV